MPVICMSVICLLWRVSPLVEEILCMIEIIAECNAMLWLATICLHLNTKYSISLASERLDLGWRLSNYSRQGFEKANTQLNLTQIHFLKTSWAFHRMNHRMFGVGRDLCGSSSPTPAKAGSPTAGCTGPCLEYLQRRRLHSLPGQSVPVLCHPQREEVLPHVQTEILPHVLAQLEQSSPILQ